MSSIDSDYEAVCSCQKFGGRLIETCTSGLFSPSQPRKFASLLARLPFFFAPILLSLPFLSLLEAPLNVTPLFPYFSLAYGVLIFILVTSLHFVVWVVNRRRRARTMDISATANPTSEWSELFAAILPDRGHSVNILIQGLLSGVLCGTALAALLPSQLTSVLGHAWPLFYLLGWLTVSLAQLPLTSAPPLETAIPVDQSGSTILRTDFLNRPTHALLFLIPAVVLTHFSTVASAIFYSFLFATPLLWLLGLLPPSAQCLSLLAERSNCLLFASTALSSRAFTILLCLIWWTLTPTLSLIPCDIATLTIFGVVSYCLSLNVFGWFLLTVSWLFSFLPIRVSEILYLSLPFKPYFVGRDEFNFSLKSLISVIVKFILLPLTCLSLLSLSHLGASFSLNSTPCQHRLYSYNSSIQLNSITNASSVVYPLFQIPTFFYLFTAFGVISPLPLISCYFLSAAQRRTLLCNLLHNPFYPRHLYNELDYDSRVQNNFLFRVSRISITMLRDFISRIFSLSFLGLFLYSSRNACTPTLLFSIAVARALHLAWRAPLALSFEITIAVFIDLFLLENLSWMSLSVGVHLLIIGVSIQLVTLFTSQLRVVLTYLGWYMVTEQSSHLTYLPEERAPLTCISFLLLPFTLLLLLPVSSLLSLTLLPLFTLPIFLPSYPRPVSYWPPLPRHSSWGGKDAVFYEQTCSEVCGVFRQLAGRGVILSPAPGQVYLLRFEDRIIFLTVHEVGYEYFCVSYKGLELAATSCHEIEATQIDDILEGHQTTRSVVNKIFNRYFFYLITPISHSVIRTYSDARSSLRAITNSRSTVQKCREYFPKCLAWLIVRQLVEERERKSKNANSKKKLQAEQTDVNPPTAVTTVINASVERNESVNVSTFQQVWSSGFSNERQTPDSIFTEELESVPDVDTLEDNILNTELDNSTEYLPESPPPNNPLGARSLLPASWSNLPTLPGGATECVELTLVQKFCSHWREEGRIMQEVEWNYIAPLVHRITSYVTSLVHPSGGDQNLDKLTGAQVCKNFYGNFQWSEGLSWLTNIPDLLDLSTKAYRYTLKLTLDEVALMLDDTDSCLIQNLTELDADWYLGCVTEEGWKQRVLNGTPHVFLLSQNPTRSKYYSHLLTLKSQLTHVASLQPESLRAIWSSQLLELVYLRNEEEERYSIQQEEHLLRNVSTQAGDSPVGYPVFSSAPLYA